MNLKKIILIKYFIIILLILQFPAIRAQNNNSQENQDPILIGDIAWGQSTGSLLVGIEIKFQDPDSDPLNVTWDFGDGSPIIKDEVGPLNNSSQPYHFIVKDHSYQFTGKYEVVVNISDGRGGSLEKRIQIKVVEDPANIKEPECLGIMVIPLSILTLILLIATVVKKKYFQ